MSNKFKIGKNKYFFKLGRMVFFGPRHRAILDSTAFTGLTHGWQHHFPDEFGHLKMLGVPHLPSGL